MSLDPTRLTNWPAVRDFVPTTHHDTYPFISTSSVDLIGKSVFITGASRGIGKGVALSFARAGCSRIAIAARKGLDDVKAEILSAAEKAGRPKPQVLAITLDVTSEAGVQAAANTVADAFGGVLDVLISNAGHVDARVPLPESDPQEWWRTWDVNLRATYCEYQRL